MNNNDLKIFVGGILVGGLIVYLLLGGATYLKLKQNYDNLEQDYMELYKNYTFLLEENKLLEQENEQLKSQQKQLTEEIASYLAEQAIIDLVGLKKYSMAYGLIKIALCSENPAIFFCL
jgi:uncharacterized protein YlxW (UPF0749 family)